MGGRGSNSGLLASRIHFFNDFKREESNKRVQETIKILDSEYDNYLTSVRSGANKSAGTVDIDGTMRLSNSRLETIYHEFAHGIATTERERLGLSDNKLFWSEIRKIHTQYKEAVSKNWKNSISAYADGARGKHALDEFFAEGFTLGKMRQHGVSDIKYPLNNFSESGRWADKIVNVTDKYFKKKKRKK